MFGETINDVNVNYQIEWWSWGKVIIVATLKGRIFWTYVVLSGLPSKISVGDNTGNSPLIFFGLMLVPFGK